MFLFKSFCDLSVCVTNLGKLEEMCNTYVELGYKVIAIDQVMSDSPITTSTKNQLSVPKRLDLSTLRKKFEGKLRILNRLTFTIFNSEQAVAILKDINTLEYDLIAAIPDNIEVIKQGSANLNVDIISFNPERGYADFWNRKMYKMAIKRGIVFEIMYAPAISSSSLRRNIIATAHGYYSCCKLKNAIISSGSSSPLEVKGPYDIINLAVILGFSEESAKFAITETVTKLLKQAACRRIDQVGPVLVGYPEFPSYKSNKSKTEESEYGGVCKKPRLEPTV